MKIHLLFRSLRNEKGISQLNHYDLLRLQTFKNTKWENLEKKTIILKPEKKDIFPINSHLDSIIKNMKESNVYF